MAMSPHNININSRVHNIHSLEGKVVEYQQWQETESATGSISEGLFYTKRIQVDFQNKVNERIFLIDKNAQEHALELPDFNLQCRQGHKLTIFWTIEKGRKNGYYFAVFNHDLHKIFFNSIALKKLFRPNLLIPFKSLPKLTSITLVNWAICLFLGYTLWSSPTLIFIIGLFVILTMHLQLNAKIRKITQNPHSDPEMHSILENSGII